MKINMNRSPKRTFRKAQIAGQVFIFILAAVLAVLIIGYGYKAIQSFVGRTEQIAFINFKTDIQTETRTILKDFGSVKRLDLQLPGKYDMLCLVDLNYALKSSTCLCNKGACPGGRENEFQPEVCDAWITPGNIDNAFLVPITPIRLSEVEIEDGYTCIPPSAGKISLRLEGRGDRTLISEWIN